METSSITLAVKRFRWHSVRAGSCISTVSNSGPSVASAPSLIVAPGVRSLLSLTMAEKPAAKGNRYVLFPFKERKKAIAEKVS